MANEFKLRRGLKNVFVAEVTADTATAYTAGTPFHLIPAGTMNRTPAVSSENRYYDDTVFAAIGSEGATAITIDGASLRASDLATIMGKYVDATTGAVLDTGEWKEKYWALGGEAEGLDGSSELFWFLKGTFTAPARDDTTEDESTTANGMQLVYNAVQTIHNFTVGTETKPMKHVEIDTTETVLASGKSWTEQVVTPENVATICEKVT